MLKDLVLAADCRELLSSWKLLQMLQLSLLVHLSLPSRSQLFAYAVVRAVHLESLVEACLPHYPNQGVC